MLRHARKCIKSYAFFDLETTGLPETEFNKTKITEICLVASSKENILVTEKNHLPRVLSKLSFCINPVRQISYESTQMTGLDNYMLENENKFDKNFVQLLNHYILQLPQPVCLVAHNGDKFDFPIIQKQLKTLNMTLPDDLLCMDSLLFFRSYEDYLEQEKLTEPKPLLDETSEETETKGTSSENIAVIENRLNTTDGELFTAETPPNGVNLQNGIVHPGTSIEFTSDIADIETTLAAENMEQKQKLNESTPSNRKTLIKKELFSKRLANYGSNSVTPPSKRQLFTPVNGDSVSPSKRMKFTLTAIHERMFGEGPNKSHYAESDTLALLKCAVASKREFIEYAEENAKFFKDVQPIGM